jgi:hypothetical protein
MPTLNRTWRLKTSHRRGIPADQQALFPLHQLVQCNVKADLCPLRQHGEDWMIARKRLTCSAPWRISRGLVFCRCARATDVLGPISAAVDVGVVFPWSSSRLATKFARGRHKTAAKAATACHQARSGARSMAATPMTMSTLFETLLFG